MTYTTFTDANVTDLAGIFTYAADTVPIFPAIILFSLFCVTTIGSFFAMRRDLGTADVAQSFAVGSFVTAVVAIMMSLIGGLISTEVLVLTIALAIGGFIWLALSSNN